MNHVSLGRVGLIWSNINGSMIKWLCTAVRQERVSLPDKLADKPFFLSVGRFVFSALICYIIILGFTVDAFAQTVVVGKLAVVKGSVVIERPGFGKVPIGKTGTELLVGDLLTAGSDAQAELMLRDSAKIHIAHGASLSFNQYSFTPDINTRKALVRLIRGKTRFVVKGNMSRESVIVVETENAKVSAYAAVDFVIDASAEETEVLALSGHVKVKNLSHIVVGEIALGENFTTVVKPKSPPSQPVVMKAKQRSEYVREVR